MFRGVIEYINRTEWAQVAILIITGIWLGAMFALAI